MIAVISSGLPGKERHDRLEKKIQSSPPSHSCCQHSTAGPCSTMAKVSPLLDIIETPCYDQNSQTPRHCKPSSKLAPPNGLYMFLTRSTGLLGRMGLSRASYRLPPGPVQSRKTDCTGVPKSVCHPHWLVTGARMSTVRNTYEILWPCT